MPEKRGLENEGESGVENGVKRVCPEPEGGRPGDWLCPGCQHHNWSFRSICQKCFTDKSGVKTAEEPQKPGDWNCSGCAHLNYAFRNTCQRCHSPKPYAASGGAASGSSRPGDWNCPTCGDVVYASRFSCRKCNTPKSAAPMMGMGGMPGAGYLTHQPGYGMDAMSMGGMNMYGGMPAAGGKPMSAPKEQRAGDWSCPKCFDINYATRSVCRLCNTPKAQVDMQQMSQISQMYGYDMSQAYSDLYGFNMGTAGQGQGAAAGGRSGPPPRRGSDWDCPNCGDLVYGTRNECRKCKTSKPEHLGAAVSGGASNPSFSKPMNGGLGPSRRAGDWDCPGCGDVQYASRSECRKCRTSKPDI